MRFLLFSGPGDGDHQFSLSGRSFREIWEDSAQEENS